MGAEWDALPKQVADERVLVDPVAVEKEHRTSRVDPLHPRANTPVQTHTHPRAHTSVHTHKHPRAHTPVHTPMCTPSDTHTATRATDAHRLTCARGGAQSRTRISDAGLVCTEVGDHGFERRA